MNAVLHKYSSWIWLGAAVTVIVSIGLLSSVSLGPGTPMSVNNARPSGALAYRLWLERSGYQVRVAPVTTLGSLDPTNTTVMMLAPDSVPAFDLSSTAIDWIHRGGRVVIGTDGLYDSLLLAELGVPVSGSASSRPKIVQPLLLSPPVAQLSGTVAAVADNSFSGVPVVESGSKPVLLLLNQPAPVWVLGAPGLLDNAHIAQADNRGLGLNLAGSPRGTVVFVEPGPTPGGTSGGDWLTGTSWGIALLYAGLTLVAYRFFAGRRLGPPAVPLSVGHRPLTEYVSSMAGLLRRGRKRQEVLTQYQDELQRVVLERYGPDASELGRSGKERLQYLLERPTALREEDLLRRSAAILEFMQVLRTSRG